MNKQQFGIDYLIRMFAAVVLLGGIFVVLATTRFTAASFADEHSAQLSIIGKEAKNGSDSAQLMYGLAYLEGRDGLAADAVKARKWILRSARGGNRYAMLVMGKLCADGRGTQKDHKRAVYWWQQAAVKGDSHAQFLLAMAYLDGNGIKKDPAKAIAWFEKSAAKGNKHAQYLLAHIYQEGKHVRADKALSRSWLERAAEQPTSTALNPFAMIYDLVLAGTPVQQQSPTDLLGKAAKGDPQAEFELGERYKNGSWDVEQNDAKAVAWISRAAKSGHKIAMKSLADIYEKGRLGVAVDMDKAKLWKQRAASSQ